MTPPKSESRRYVQTKVSKWEKKYGYDFDCPEHEVDPMLRQKRQEFLDKATKQCGGFVMCKKQTRFDKMRMKEENGFVLEELDVRKQLRRVDHIMTALMKKTALFELRRLK